MTIPVEARYFGMKIALVRNSLAFVFALVVGLTMGVLWSLFGNELFTRFDFSLMLFFIFIIYSYVIRLRARY